MQEIVIDHCQCPTEITLGIEIINLVPGTKYTYKLKPLNADNIYFTPDSGTFIAESNTYTFNSIVFIGLQEIKGLSSFVSIEVLDPFYNRVRQDTLCLKFCGSPQCSLTPTPTPSVTPIYDNSVKLESYGIVGHISNDPDSDTGKGEVSYYYGLAKNSITVNQWIDFLNSVSYYDDPFNLYKEEWSNNSVGIIQKFNGSEYCYSLNLCADGQGGCLPEDDLVAGSYPVTGITWFDAIRYCNWLHNGKPKNYPGVGVTETGAYNIYLQDSVVEKTADARFWLPTEDELYKASFYDGDIEKYYNYSTLSDDVSGISCWDPNKILDLLLSTTEYSDLKKDYNFSTPANVSADLMYLIRAYIERRTGQSYEDFESIFSYGKYLLKIENDYYFLFTTENFPTLLKVDYNRSLTNNNYYQNIRWGNIKPSLNSYLSCDTRPPAYGINGALDLGGSVKELTDTNTDYTKTSKVTFGGSYLTKVPEYKQISKYYDINSLKINETNQDVGFRIAVNPSIVARHPLRVYCVGGTARLNNNSGQGINIYPGSTVNGEPFLISTLEYPELSFAYSYEEDIEVAKLTYPGYNNLTYASLELVMVDSENKVVAYLTTNNTGDGDPCLVSCGYSANIFFGYLPKLKGKVISNSWVLGGGPTTISNLFSVNPYTVVNQSLLITPTPTSTPANTPTNTSTPTQTNTQTKTPTTTPTKTPRVTYTPTTTPTLTATPTQTRTPTATQTPSNTASVTPTATATNTPTTTLTSTPTTTVTLTSTPTQTPTNTTTLTSTPSNTPTQTVTPSNTPSQTSTITPTPTITPSMTSIPSNVYAWGSNLYQQLGFSPELTRDFIDPYLLDVYTNNRMKRYNNIVGYTDPNDIVNSINFKSVAVGSNFSGGIDASGNIHMVGDNAWGQLGLGNYTSKNLFNPIVAESGVSFTELSLGASHSVALDNNGNIWTWGRNSDGQLGQMAIERPVLSVSLTNSYLNTYDIVVAGDVSDEFSLNDNINLKYYNGIDNVQTIVSLIGSELDEDLNTVLSVEWLSSENIDSSVVATVVSINKQNNDPGLLSSAFPRKVNVYKEYKFCINKKLDFYVTPTPTTTVSNTSTITNTPSISQTNTPSVTATQTSTSTPTTTATNTPSITATNTVTPTISVTPSNTASSGQVVTETPTNTPTKTSTPTPTQTPTNTKTPTTTRTPTSSQTSTITTTPTNTPTTTTTTTITSTPTVTPTKLGFVSLYIRGDKTNIINNNNKQYCLVNLFGEQTVPALYNRIKILDVDYDSNIQATIITIDHPLIKNITSDLVNNIKYVSIVPFFTEDNGLVTYSYDSFSKVYAGESHSMALNDDDKLFVVGSDKWGQLGIGKVQEVVNNVRKQLITILTNFTMTNPPPLKDCETFRWKKLSLGRFHTMGLDTNGVLWGWGNNQFNQVGIQNVVGVNSKIEILNITEDDYPSPYALDRNLDRTAYYAPLPVKIYIIGDNTSGETNFEKDVWIDVACGGYHTLAIKKEFIGNDDYGSLWAWGSNSDDQTAVSSSVKIIDEATTTTKIINEIKIVSFDNTRNYWTRVFAGRLTSFAVNSVARILYSWGRADMGQTGNVSNRVGAGSKTITKPKTVDNTNWVENRVNISNDIGDVSGYGISSLAHHTLILPSKNYS